MEIRSPETQKEFKDYYHLRWKILRQPWQQPEGSEQDNEEDTSYHIIAVENNRIAGVARLQVFDKEQLQLRYMAVDNVFQGTGVGRKIMQHAESHARQQGYKAIILNARENALGFYLRLGYQQQEKTCLLFDSIQHYKMHKTL